MPGIAWDAPVPSVRSEGTFARPSLLAAATFASVTAPAAIEGPG